MSVLDDIFDVSIKVDEINKFTGTQKDKLEMIKNDYLELSDYISSGKCYSEARGKLIRSDESIKPEEFTTAIFNVFRDGGNVRSQQVSAKEIKEAYERFYKYPDYLNI